MRRLLLLILMLCLTVPISQAQEGHGLIRQGVISDFDSDISSFNPLYCSDTACEIVTDLLFPTLLATDHNTHWFTAGTQENNAIATDWTISSDNQVYTFQLRDDAFWSDGTPISAYDYFYSYLAVKNRDVTNPNIPTTGIQENIEGVVPLSATELAVILSKNNCDALPYLDLPFIPIHVFDESFAETTASFFADGDNVHEMWTAWNEAVEYNSQVMRNHPFNDLPSVTAGNFQFVDWDEKEHIRLQSGDLAYELLPFDSQTEIVNRFLSGDLDVLNNVPMERIADFENNPELQIIETDLSQRVYIVFNLADPLHPMNAFDEDGNPLEQGEHPILSNLDVRSAIQFGINRQEVIDISRHGQANPISSYFIPTTWGYDEGMNHIEFNTDEAEQLLENAGWVRVGNNSIRECVNCDTAEEGRRLNVSLGYYESNNAIAVAAIVIQQQLRRIGIAVSLVPTTFSNSSNQGFDMYLSTWENSYPEIPNLDSYFTPAADIISSSGAWNIASYDNPDVTQLIHEAQTLVDCNLAERQAIYSDVDQILQEDLPYIWLYANTEIHAYDADIQNIITQANSPFWNLEDWVVFDAP